MTWGSFRLYFGCYLIIVTMKYFCHSLWNGCKYIHIVWREWCCCCCFSGDSLSYHDGMQFTTYDNDNDILPRNCAQVFDGAWWYKSCHWVNLNGKYYPNGETIEFASHINWFGVTGNYRSMKTTDMKVRLKVWYGLHMARRFNINAGLH